MKTLIWLTSVRLTPIDFPCCGSLAIILLPRDPPFPLCKKNRDLSHLGRW